MEALNAINTSLLAKETTLNAKEKELREKLGVGHLLIEENNKLKNSVKINDKAGISAAELMIETATELSQKLNANISDIGEKQRNVECQKRKLIEKSLGAIPSKQPRLSASLTKPVSKNKKKSTGKKKTTTQGV